MKTFKVICAAVILALSLSIPAYADGNPGDGHGPGRTSPDTIDTGISVGSTDSTATAASDEGFATYADLI